MADELRLKVKSRSTDEGELTTLEYLVGEDEESIEPVGKIISINYKNIIYYKAYPTEHIRSFHLRNDALEHFCVKLEPGQEVTLRTGDQIGWGATEPWVVTEISYHPRNDKYIN